MAVDLIRYDLLVQVALRRVVRDVLSSASRDGLPGEHHFYVSFQTHARGVRLSNRMRDRYPDEMTIVLQHQFWDLSVTDEAFEVGLSFQNISEMLVVPFDAITRFTDPAVGFELQFAVEAAAAEPKQSEGLTQPGTSPARVHEPSTQLPQEGTEKKREAVNQAGPAPQSEPKVVSIDAFRKKS